MSRKNTLALLAAASLLLVAMLVWRVAAGTAESVTPSAAGARPELERSPDLGAIPSADNAATTARADERSAVANDTHPQVAPRPLPPHEYALDFTVTDADDAPLAGAHVFVAPRMHPLNDAGRTDGEGRLTVKWRALVESMDVVVAAGNDSGAPSEFRLVHVDAAAEQHVALRAVGAPHIVAFHGGGQLFQIELSHSVPVRSDVPVLATIFNSNSRSDVAAMRPCEDGFADFVDPSMALSTAEVHQGAFVVASSALDMDTSVILESLQLEMNSRLTFQFQGSIERLLLQGQIDTPHFTLQGHVLELEGKPLGGVLVRVRREGTHDWASARSDDEGHYEFAQLDVANYEFVAGDGDNGLARATIGGAAGVTVDHEARLDRGHELNGRLLGADGHALGHWAVELSRADLFAPWIDCATTDDAGRFRIPSLPGGSFTLLAQPTDPGSAFPLVVAPNVWPTGEPQDFTISPAEFGALRLEVVDEDDQPLAGAEVHLWRSDIERGLRMGNGSAATVFASDSLFPGAYRVEIGVPARGWIAVEQLFVQAGETLDLGRIRFAAPARIDVVASSRATGAPVHWLFLRAGPEVESLSSEIERKPAFTIEIAAGTYEQAKSFEELAGGDKLVLRSGEPHRLALPAPAARADH